MSPPSRTQPLHEFPRANERSALHAERILTLLPIVAPVAVGGREVYLTQACHERDLPQNSLLPRADRVDVDVPPRARVVARVLICVLRDGLELDAKLLRLEAVCLQIVEVRRLEVGASPLEPCALVWREAQPAELCNMVMRLLLVIVGEGP